MNNLKFYFWQSYLNPHESGCISELAQSGFTCSIIAQNGLLEGRIQTGLCEVDYGSADVTVLGDDYQSFVITPEMQDINSVHVFTGISAFEFTKFFFNRVRYSDALIFMLHESRDTRGLRGYVRWLDSIIFEYPYRRRVDKVLAIGNLGVNWFTKCLYKKEQIVPFFYSINKVFNREVGHNLSSEIKIAFVGSLIERKNPLLIIEAMKSFKVHKIQLNYFGIGPLSEKIAMAARSLPNNISVIMHGATPNNLIAKNLETVDLLILPSRWDGWGAVVNEALTSGCDVIVSDKCGASSAIKESYGDVFKENDFNDLAKKIKKLIPRYPKPLKDRVLTIDESNIISGKTASMKLLVAVKESYGKRK